MKLKRFLASFLAFFLIFGSLVAFTPAFAQSNNGFQGFNPFSAIVQFFEKIFHFGNEGTPATSNQNVQIQGFESGNKMPQDSNGNRPIPSPQDATGSSILNRQRMEEQRLSQLVTQGKITEEQKQAILTELQTVGTKYSMQNQTQVQMQENFTAMQTELTTWANAQGIDPTYVLPQGRNPGGPGMGGQGGRGRGFGPRPSGSPPE